MNPKIFIVQWGTGTSCKQTVTLSTPAVGAFLRFPEHNTHKKMLHIRAFWIQLHDTEICVGDFRRFFDAFKLLRTILKMGKGFYIECLHKVCCSLQAPGWSASAASRVSAGVLKAPPAQITSRVSRTPSSRLNGGPRWCTP